MDSSTAITARPTHWRETLLICKKCSKKVKGGFGPKSRMRLRKALAEAMKLREGRHAAIGLIEVGCFDLCPKRAVTVAKGTEPGKLFVVPRGAALDAIIAKLGLAAPDAAPSAALEEYPEPAPTLERP
jgi:hypothetical protein